MMNHQAGREMLLKMEDILDEYRIPFFLFQGTALGAYRDKGFCPTEKDIDLGVLHENLFIERWKTLDLVERFIYEGFDVEIFTMGATAPVPRTLVIWGPCGVKVDLVGLIRGVDEKLEAVRYTYGPHRPWDGERYALVHTAPVMEPPYTRVEMFGRAWWAPSPLEAYLESEYGPDWRTPRDDSVSRLRRPNWVERNVARG